MRWSCPLQSVSGRAIMFSEGSSGGGQRIDEGPEQRVKIIDKFLEKASQAQIAPAAEVARQREILEARPRFADGRLESLDDCQPEQHRMKTARRAEAPEFTAKDTMKVAVPEKMKFLGAQRGFRTRVSKGTGKRRRWRNVRAMLVGGLSSEEEAHSLYMLEKESIQDVARDNEANFQRELHLDRLQAELVKQRARADKEQVGAAAQSETSEVEDAAVVDNVHWLLNAKPVARLAAKTGDDQEQETVILNRGARLTVKDANGQMPTELASDHGHVEERLTEPRSDDGRGKGFATPRLNRSGDQDAADSEGVWRFTPRTTWLL